MKILALSESNFLRIRLIEVELPENGGLVEIVGKNCTGKTSFLKGIWAILGGKYPPNPIKDGENESVIVMKTEDFTATLTFKRLESADEKGKAYADELIIEDHKGIMKKNPRTYLNKLVGKISISPIKFIEDDAKTRLQELTRILEIPIDMEAWESEYKKLYAERTEANVNVRNIEGALQKMPFNKDIGTEEKSVSDLTGRYEKAQTVHLNHDANVRNRAKTLDEMEKNRARILELESQAKKLANENLDYLQAVDALNVQINQVQLPDLEIIKSELTGSQAFNKMVQENQAIEEKKIEIKSAKEEHGRRDKVLTDHIQKRKQALQAIEFPIPGLSLADESNDLMLTNDSGTFRFDDLNFAKQLEISVALAMMRNPEIKMITIDEGSNFDEDSKKIISDLAEKYGFIVVMAGVQYSDDQPGIHISDGARINVEKG